ncbi:unnamed protein product [Sphagnum tenellum]
MFSLELNVTRENHSIGDFVGLFPITYADRLKYARDLTWTPSSRSMIRVVVETHIYGFPYHLDDRTISRPTWAGGLFDPRGKACCPSIEEAWQVLAASVLVDGAVVDTIGGTGMTDSEGEYDRYRDYINAGPELRAI